MLACLDLGIMRMGLWDALAKFLLMVSDGHVQLKTMAVWRVFSIIMRNSVTSARFFSLDLGFRHSSGYLGIFSPNLH